MSETKGLTRQQMADRVAREFQDGWIVNLGVGIPTMCSNTDIGDRDIIYHSENGVIGYGPIAPEGRGRSEPGQCRRAERDAEGRVRRWCTTPTVSASSAAGISMRR